ncbi:hypothetical protein [Streptomyces europaeiscabiei]|uniref:hypothetical protein n=1 Tax=Streptomyces europaeiscabiei TaxID=146819 RepID=UPI0029BC8A33|nr:hypothetical protein [Streptomyces europaeiscabiei]MDX2771569.1 hypothetical protein [Streptomyces europaeiscabiei]
MQVNSSAKPPSEDDEPPSVAEKAKNLIKKHKKKVIIGGTVLVVTTGLLIHLANRQRVAEGVETWSPFPGPASEDQEGETKCVECETSFDVAEARTQYQSEPGTGEGEYDDLHGGEWCAECALARAEGLENQGRAIFMMNGDEDYDDDFVQQWL